MDIGTCQEIVIFLDFAAAEKMVFPAGNIAFQGLQKGENQVFPPAKSRFFRLKSRFSGLKNPVIWTRMVRSPWNPRFIAKKPVS